jgi:hypothetical protein
MTYFLLVVTFMLSNGQRGVTIEKFDTHSECFKAMTIVSKQIPNVTATCNEMTRGYDEMNGNENE